MIRRSLMLIAAAAFVVGVCWKIHAQSSAPVFTATQYVARSSAIWVFELP